MVNYHHDRMLHTRAGERPRSCYLTMTAKDSSMLNTFKHVEFKIRDEYMAHAWRPEDAAFQRPRDQQIQLSIPDEED